MSTPHGSIPGYRPGPILSGSKKALLASFVVFPVAAYFYINNQRAQEAINKRLLEEEGRRNWKEGTSNANQKLGVQVNRSGGGV